MNIEKIENYDFYSERTKRLDKRNLIESYCRFAEYYLPAEKKLLFLMYHRHAYKSGEIAKLLGVHRITVVRRLGKIGREITSIMKSFGILKEP